MSDETPELGEVVEDEPKAEIALREQVVSMSPTTPMGEWNVMVAQADVLAKSQIIPVAYRGKPANIVAAALTGRPYGWDVMAAMRNGHVIEGTYAIRPEAQLGLIRAAGHLVTGEVTGEGITCKATVTGKRCDDGTEMTVSYSFDQGVQAGLVSIQEGRPYARSSNGKVLSWESTPEDMVWVRAVSRLARRQFSDVTLGLSYTADEVTGGAFYEDATGEAVAATKAADEVPTGWASWDECNAAHDAYIERWRGSPTAARQAVTLFTREHEGYVRPMVKAKLNALEAKLTQEIERAPADPPAGTEDDGESGGPGPGGTIPTGQSGGGVSAQQEPAADPTTDVVEASEVGADGLPVEDADIVGEGDADAPAETTAAPAEAPSSTETAGNRAPARSEPVDGPVAAAGATPPSAAAAGPPPTEELASPGEKARFATLMAEVFLPAERELARHALVAIVSNGRTRTSTELTTKEIAWGIKGAKLFGQGALVFGVVNDQDVPEPLEQFSVPTAEQVPSLFSAAPEGGTTAPGGEYVAKLGAFLRGE